MASTRFDEETKIRHITVDGMTLCGILIGWTRKGEEPVKEKWGCTCAGCQEELEELRRIRKYHG